MQHPTLPAEKFQRLLDYLTTLGIDRSEVVAAAGLVESYIEQQHPEAALPAVHYSRLYKRAVAAMQTLNSRVPWAGGLGTDAFEMLCRAIIGADTLREALERAERFSAVLEPITGSRIHVEIDAAEFSVHFHWADSEAADLFAPATWYRREGARAVALASGLLLWHGLLSWLIGHSLKVLRVDIGAAMAGDGYARAVADAMAVMPEFGSEQTCLVLPVATLDFRVVQNHESLQDFLDESVLQLIRIEQQPASIGEAVKRLLGTDFTGGMRSFAQIAACLHMSESSLRRRLIDEATSFQTLKDEVRCELAKQFLADPEQKISAIAERLGFTEQSSFGRSFRQWTGMTPRAWRDASLAADAISERCCP